jgi:hypothetical protein
MAAGGRDIFEPLGEGGTEDTSTDGLIERPKVLLAKRWRKRWGERI